LLVIDVFASSFLAAFVEIWYRVLIAHVLNSLLEVELRTASSTSLVKSLL
jgi:hypothetical protein